MAHFKTGNILAIGDLHEPVCRPEYLDFCNDTKKKYKCDHVIQVGDLVDLHNVSYHERDQGAPSLSEELIQARFHLKEWKKAFRNVSLCYGNHDLLIARKAKTHGLSMEFFRSLNEIFDLPDTWVWNNEHIINNVLFIHGTGFSGKYPHANAMYYHRTNIVIGHCHSVAAVHWSASKKDRLFGMAVGCGVDDKAAVMSYGKNMPRKSVISCGVILDNGKLPIVIPMEL